MEKRLEKCPRTINGVMFNMLWSLLFKAALALFFFSLVEVDLLWRSLEMLSSKMAKLVVVVFERCSLMNDRSVHPRSRLISIKVSWSPTPSSFSSCFSHMPILATSIPTCIMLTLSGHSTMMSLNLHCLVEKRF